jgi:hypothetical protein
LISIPVVLSKNSNPSQGSGSTTTGVAASPEAEYDRKKLYGAFLKCSGTLPSRMMEAFLTLLRIAGGDSVSDSAQESAIAFVTNYLP